MPRRGENIYKRKDGRWEARYVKEVSIDGYKKYESVYAKTYNEDKLTDKCMLILLLTEHDLLLVVVFFEDLYI